MQLQPLFTAVRHARPASGSARPRAGAALLIAVVMLMVATSLAVGMLQAIVREHRQLQQRHRQHQSIWLAESGIELAVARLRQDARYAGEDWLVTLGESESRFRAAVKIEVTTDEQDPSQRMVRAVAVYPTGLPHRVTHTKQVVISLPKSE